MTKILVPVVLVIPRKRRVVNASRPERDRFERRQIATVTLRAGETLAVQRMRELGVTPVELRVVER